MPHPCIANVTDKKKSEFHFILQVWWMLVTFEVSVRRISNQTFWFLKLQANREYHSVFFIFILYLTYCFWYRCRKARRNKYGDEINIIIEVKKMLNYVKGLHIWQKWEHKNSQILQKLPTVKFFDISFFCILFIFLLWNKFCLNRYIKHSR